MAKAKDPIYGYRIDMVRDLCIVCVSADPNFVRRRLARDLAEHANEIEEVMSGSVSNCDLSDAWDSFDSGGISSTELPEAGASLSNGRAPYIYHETRSA